MLLLHHGAVALLNLSVHSSMSLLCSLRKSCLHYQLPGQNCTDSYLGCASKLCDRAGSDTTLQHDTPSGV